MTGVAALTVHPAARGLRGCLRVPGDKSISHRAVLVAARAEGTSVLRGLSTGLDVAATLDAVVAFGAEVDRAARGEVRIDGGAERLHEPESVVDVGNSGTAIRLLAGWAAGIDGLTVLEGDASIARRPMARVAAPLRAMGATVDGRSGGAYPPLVVRGGGLHGVEHRPAVASAQVKGCVLLAGLAADGETTVREPVPTRRHTEELLARFGADVDSGPGWATVRRSVLRGAAIDVPADPSQAAFSVVAASVVPGSDLRLERVYVGPGRAAYLDVLRRMGADIELEPAAHEPDVADLRVRSAALRAADIGGDEVPGLIDEVPALALAAAFAAGTTTVADAGELRVKESDRIRETVRLLRGLGVDAEERPDGLAVAGRPGLRPPGGHLDAGGDHRIAMALAVAALAAQAPVTVGGWEVVATSYPGFEEDLQRCAS